MAKPARNCKPDPAPAPAPAPAPKAAPDTTTVVWAFKDLAKLNNRTGIVEVKQSLADSLIASGDAQDMRVGLLALKPIVTSHPKHSGDNAMRATPYNDAATPPPATHPLVPATASPAPGAGIMTTSIALTGGPSPAATATITLTVDPTAVAPIPTVAIPVNTTLAAAATLIRTAINTGSGTNHVAATGTGGIIILTASAPTTGILTASIAIA